VGNCGCVGIRCGRNRLYRLDQSYVKFHPMKGRADLEEETAKVAAFPVHLAVEGRVAVAGVEVG